MIHRRRLRKATKVSAEPVVPSRTTATQRRLRKQLVPFYIIAVVSCVFLWNTSSISTDHVLGTGTIGPLLGLPVLKRPVLPRRENEASLVAINRATTVVASTTGVNDPPKTMAKPIVKPITMEPITIITPLTGETGNWLLYIAKSKAIQWRLQQAGIPSTLVYQVKQTHKRCNACINFITKCFPNLSDLNFHDKASPKFLERAQAKRELWFHEHVDNRSQFDPDIYEVTTEMEEDNRLQQFQKLLQSHKATYDAGRRHNISVPFIVNVAFIQARDYDDFYDELRSLLLFDDEKCCGAVPDPNVSVLHYRGFSAEESLSKTRSMGREELSPNKVSHELFSHLGKGDRLALLSRYNESSLLVQGHLTALRTKGVDVEFIHQSPEQDFCYLRHAQKELAGLGYSTFVRFAGFLTKYQPKVRLYCLDSPDTRRLGKTKCRYFNFQRQQQLQKYFVSETYRSDEMDKVFLSMGNATR